MRRGFPPRAGGSWETDLRNEKSPGAGAQRHEIRLFWGLADVKPKLVGGMRALGQMTNRCWMRMKNPF
ncbi:MAG: hypothetical protein CM15mP95_2320 [Alphaproteobacteria bacterium]|nr:MAG: hypothetical protein CM15mP95_2320 [Alphaproteobacteria bacterium]